MNLLACSPYVIAVASSDTHQTPGYQADDTISPFSSGGDGQQFNPTIAAPGQEVGVPHPYGPHGRNLVINGTSFSTPFTCGILAMMLEANPALTFEQVKRILQLSAVPVAHSPADEGAGVLNPQQAVIRALQSRSQAV
jgi:subtilase family serine protease